MIAIKDMEMPKCCHWDDCPLCNEDGGACQLEDVRTSEKERPKDCPLVEIVTCKDCKNNKNGICPNYRHFVDDDFYCADAKKK